MGKPDWEKLEDYNFLKHLTKSQWAWEFLRRNPEYIASWKRYMNALVKQQEDPGPPYADELCGPYPWGIKGPRYIDPEDDTPDIEWLPLVESGFIMKVTRRPPKGKNHRFMGPLLPDYDTGKVFFPFNFHKEIEPQIIAAKKELHRLQKESMKEGKKLRTAFKPRRDEWSEFLQVTDAIAAGIKPGAIARVLYPVERKKGESKGQYGLRVSEKTKKVCERRDQAKRYIDADYRLIPYSEE